MGYIPLVPGTFGSIAAAVVIWLLKDNPAGYVAFCILITATGFLVSSAAEKVFKRKDAECIVIDEVAGMFLSLLFLPVNGVSLFCAFLLFRGFDAMKIYPADRMQQLGGSRGVMLDDVVAAVYVNLILQVVLRLFSWSTS